MSLKIEVPQEEITAFCQRHHIHKLAFFAMQRELSEILGSRADLNTAKDLSPYFRQEVLDEAEVLYVAA